MSPYKNNRPTRWIRGVWTLMVVLVANLFLALSANATGLSNLIAHWNFEETSGVFLHDSTGNHDAETVGPIFSTPADAITLAGLGLDPIPRFEGSANPGAIGNAWAFPGNNQFDNGDVGVQPSNIDAFINLGPSFSYSAWFKTDIDLAATDDTPSTIFSISNNEPFTSNRGKEILIRLNDDPGIDGGNGTVGGVHYRARRSSDPQISKTTTVAVDTAPATWHHVVLTQGGVGTGWAMYLDGVLNISGPEVASPADIGATVVNIGRNDDDNGYGGINNLGNPHDPGEWTFGGDPVLAPDNPKPNVGLLDDISIWNVPLTAQDVSNIYNGGLAGLEAPQALLAGVPEPSGLALIILAGTTCLTYCRRSTSRKIG